jgi:hypothetical protein
VFCGHARHQHHIRYRSQGGLETTGNLVTLCDFRFRGCHEAVHARRIVIVGTDADGELTFERVDEREERA